METTPIISWRDRLLAAWYRRPEHPAKRRLLGWAHRLLCLPEVTVSVAPGVTLRLDPRDFVEREILFHGAYEPVTLSLVRRLLSPGAVFVDVGAHVGQYSLHALAVVGSKGRVLAFEPSPATAARFRWNASLSSATGVILHHFALSDIVGVAALHHPVFHSVHGFNSGGATLAASSGGAEYQVALLPCTAVPALANLARIDVLKIDVEGHELQVLHSLFVPGVPRPKHIVLEYLPATFPEAATIPALLREQGYALSDVDGSPFEQNALTELPEGNLWARLTA